MKEYYVTLTYIATVMAENEDEAISEIIEEVQMGELSPNDIEVEEKN